VRNSSLIPVSVSPGGTAEAFVSSSRDPKVFRRSVNFVFGNLFAFIWKKGQSADDPYHPFR
jgi:hypothetical protein